MTTNPVPAFPLPTCPDDQRSEAFDEDPVAAIYDWACFQAEQQFQRPHAIGKGFSLEARARINAMQAYSDIISELFAEPENAVEICQRWKQAVIGGDV